LKRYLYLEAAQKSTSGKKEKTKQQQTDAATQDIKQPNAGIAQKSRVATFEAKPVQYEDYSKQELLIPSTQRAFDSVPVNIWYEFQNKLFSRNLQSSIRSLMFTGTHHGCGVTTAVVNFGRAISGSTGRKVLIIDANLRTPRLHSIFNLDPANGVSELFMDKRLNAFNLIRVGKEQLFVLTSGRNSSEGVNYLESDRFDALLQEVSNKFDYTIVDSAPSSKFADPQSICSLVDGVVLVIEAGKTRRQVALKAKEELENAGANILGIILNKRKYYIPEWIYKRL
jgi:capsular exopolysaccharide synthesis family protein